MFPMETLSRFKFVRPLHDMEFSEAYYNETGDV